MMRARARITGGVLAGLSFLTAYGDQPAPATAPVDPTPVVLPAAPRVFYTHPGQFEIVVTEAKDAQQAMALGRMVWSALSAPLDLPAGGFSSPVSVRLVPQEFWEGAAPFLVTVETPGRVLVRVRWTPETDPMDVRRAFVQGLIMRQAVAWHGAAGELAAPLWLEHACAAWSLVHERPAMLDSFQQDFAFATVPPLRALLNWERGAVISRTWDLASFWLFLQLQAESGLSTRWRGWIRAVLGGASGYDTLPRVYTGLWATADAQELWWQTSARHQSRLRMIPSMSAENSRAWMADRSRWVVGQGGQEIVLPLTELWDVRKEKWMRQELSLRSSQTTAVLGTIHPFYVNAAISMGRLYEAALKGRKKDFDQELEAFRRDAFDGRELEDAVNETLDTAPRN